MLAHGHPRYSQGGGEVASYRLCQEYRRQGHRVFFLARGEHPVRTGDKLINATDTPDDFLINTSIGDWFTVSCAESGRMAQEVTDLVQYLRPDVVHFHHYMHLGLEMLSVVRRACPNSIILLTLHEFMGICLQNGQMYTTQDKLCTSSDYVACAKCFPERSPSDFFLRKQYFLHHFLLMDGFIAPSKFLRSRYVAWGLPEEHFEVIENGMIPLARAPLEPGDPLHVAFFGQITPYKGVDVLLEACAMLTKQETKRLKISLYGGNLQWHPQEFQDKIHRLLKEAPDCVTWHGPYKPTEAERLYADVDAVIVPSIWWENSPLVIQEAFAMGRPVLCSNIGGMAEKVRDGIDGLHFEPGSPKAIVAVLRRLLTNHKLLPQLAQGIKPPFSVSRCAEAHLAFIGRLVCGKQTVGRTTPQETALPCENI